MGSALAALIGGFGQAAHQQHSQQMEIDRSNRQALSQMISNLAARATPEEIPQLLQMQADIYGNNKPISKSDIPFRIMTTAAGMQQRRLGMGNTGAGTQFPPQQAAQGQPTAAAPAQPAQPAAASTPLDSMISGLPGAGKGIVPAAPDIGPSVMP